MKSMTGFGYREYQDEKIHLILELKSYNNRYLDLIVSLPPPVSPLESRIRSFLSERFSRGRVELSLRMRELEENITIHIDNRAAERYAEALRGLCNRLKINDEVRLGHILGMEGVVKNDKSRDMETYWQLILPLLNETSAQMEEDRVREGAATERDILSLTSVIEDATEKIAGYIPEIEKSMRDDIRKRFNEVAGNEIDENRLLTETAALLARFDINEEIQRLRAHTASFRQDAAGKGPVGKKLDFIAQEMNREINTIGSKSGFIPISGHVIEVKNTIEQIREQLRNVE